MTTYLLAPAPIRTVCYVDEKPLPNSGKWVLGLVSLLAAAVIFGTFIDLQINHDVCLCAS
jgi:hypothetical protein